MNISLSIATENDLVLVERYVRAYHEFEGILNDQSDIASVIRPLLGRSGFGRVWLINLDSQPIGYVVICFGYAIEFTGRDAFVDELFIIEEQRGRGAGKATLALVKSEAASLGVNALHLEVAHTNEQAQHLYRSAGFTARERYLLMSVSVRNADVQ